MNTHLPQLLMVGPLLCGLFVLLTKPGYTQTGSWEYDRMQVQNLRDSVHWDSLVNHLKGNWEIRLNYGWRSVPQSAISREEAVYVLPRRGSLWHLSVGWHPSERLYTELSVGFQLTRDDPGRPDIFAVLYGDDIEIEGAGSVFLPIGLGLTYYLTKNRFRPLVGLQLGNVIGQYRYILAEGNIVDGITSTEFESTERAPFVKWSIGFDYRMSPGTQLLVSAGYFTSSGFGNPIGGFKGYDGLHLSLGMGFVIGGGRVK